MDITAMFPKTAQPEPDDAGEGGALVKALEQIRDLCDQIEAKQLAPKKPGMPGESDVDAEDPGEAE